MPRKIAVMLLHLTYVPIQKGPFTASARKSRPFFWQLHRLLLTLRQETTIEPFTIEPFTIYGQFDLFDHLAIWQRRKYENRKSIAYRQTVYKL